MSSEKARPRTRVRVYRPADFPAVVELWRRTGIGVGPSDRFRELERMRKRDPSLFLVAESRGGLAGVVLGRFDGRRGWIHHLAVDPSLQRQGLGRRLVTVLERQLARRGCAKVNLNVLPENAPVCRFYESLGYRRRELIFMDKWLRGPRPSAASRS